MVSARSKDENNDDDSNQDTYDDDDEAHREPSGDCRDPFAILIHAILFLASLSRPVMKAVAGGTIPVIQTGPVVLARVGATGHRPLTLALADVMRLDRITQER